MRCCLYSQFRCVYIYTCIHTCAIYAHLACFAIFVVVVVACLFEEISFMDSEYSRFAQMLMTRRPNYTEFVQW